jgi:tRNA (guanine-N7-)-methyltransferase
MLLYYPAGKSVFLQSVATMTPTNKQAAGVEDTDGPEDSSNLSGSSSSPPWTDPKIRLKASNPRFRQHANPLTRKFQQPAQLAPGWPASAYTDCSKPLHVDIGCGKGGYLWSLSDKDPSYNYLGLELRPGVATFAKQRLGRPNMTDNQRGSLDYIGCNANVDLGRILSMYQPGMLARVTIQFPDPHFKTRNAKRRVVTDDLIHQIAQSNMPVGGLIFLQSDVKGTFMATTSNAGWNIEFINACSVFPEALDFMRFKFGENPCFTDDLEGKPDEYVETNILGVATEREISVLERNLPVFRAVFRRNSQPC